MKKFHDHRDTEQFTVYIKNSIAFPHFGKKFVQTPSSWCKLVAPCFRLTQREVPEDNLTSLMSVNVEKAKNQILSLASRLPYVESQPDARNI